MPLANTLSLQDYISGLSINELTHRLQKKLTVIQTTCGGLYPLEEAIE